MAARAKQRSDLRCARPNTDADEDEDALEVESLFQPRSRAAGSARERENASNGIGRDRHLFINTPPSESGFLPNKLDATFPNCMVPIDGITNKGGV